MRSMHAVVIVIVAAALVSACVGDVGESGEAGSPANCLRVPQALLQTIGDGLTVRAGGSLSEGRAHRSGAHRNAYFVAAEIDGPGLEGSGDIGVWFVSGSLRDPGFILAVPHIATEFSEWGDASQTDAAATMSDAGARESRECLESVQP